MSLIIQCPTCPTQLSVADNLLGQQVRCPKCNTVIQVNAPAPAAAVPKPRPSGPVARPQPKPMAPQPSAAVKTPPPVPVRRQAPDATPRANPTGPKSRKNLFLVVLILGIGAGGAAGYYGLQYIPYFKRADATSPSASNAPAGQVSDLVFLPNDCQVVASLNASAVLKSKSYKSLAEEGAGVEESEQALVRRLVGVGPEEIERLTLGARLTDKPEWTLVVRTTRPVKLDDLKGESSDGPKVKGTQIYVKSSTEGFFLADERTIVLGTPSVLENVAEHGGPATLAAGLKTVYQPVNDTWSLWVGIDPSAAPKQNAPAGPGGPDMTAMLKQLTAVVVEAPADKPLELQVVFHCKDDATAQTVAAQLNPLLPGLLILAPPAALAPMSTSMSRENLRLPRSRSRRRRSSNRSWRRLGKPGLLDRAAVELEQRHPPEGDEPAQAESAAFVAPVGPRTRRGPEDARGRAEHPARTQGSGRPGCPGGGPARDAPAGRHAPTRGQGAARLRPEGQARRPCGPAPGPVGRGRRGPARGEAGIDDLGPLGPDDATQLAAVAANEKADPRARASAMRALIALTPDDPKLIDNLIGSLKDKSKELRAAAAVALGGLGGKHRDTVFPALVTALKDMEEAVRTAAAAGLDRLGAPTDKESPLLVEAFKAPDATPLVMTTAAKLLGKAGPAAGQDAFALLLGGLSHDDKTVREACGAALEALPAPDAAETPALVQKLEDAKSSAETRRFVLKTLVKFGAKLDRTKVPTLAATLMKVIENDAALAEPALQVFAALGPPGPDDVPALMHLMQNKTASAATRGYAAKVLAPLGATSPEVAKALLAGLADNDAAIRRLAAEGLLKAGLKKSEEAEALAKGLDDKDVGVRMNVVTALAAMPPEAKTYGHLLRAYVDADAGVMTKAVEALKTANPDREALAAAVQSRHLSVRLYALSELADKKEGAGVAALEPLVRATRNNSATVRLLAVKALAASGADPAQLAPTLVGKMKDMAPEVRAAALLALVKLKQEPKEVVPVLLEIALDKTNPGQAQAAEALTQLGEWAKPALPQLMAAFLKEDTRGAAGPALACMGKEVVKDLDDLLAKSAKDPAMQVAVLETLAQIGPPAHRAANGLAGDVQRPLGAGRESRGEEGVGRDSEGEVGLVFWRLSPCDGYVSSRSSCWPP